MRTGPNMNAISKSTFYESVNIGTQANIREMASGHYQSRKMFLAVNRIAV